MTRRAFLQSFAIGLAALQLRFRPQPFPAAPAPLDIDALFDQLHAIRATRGPWMTILTSNPAGENDWVYRRWMESSTR